MTLGHVPRRIVMALIRGYQLTLSHLVFTQCRFEPSCSRYTLVAVERYGALKGSWLGVRRILRCHPFHPGGYDPLHRVVSARVKRVTPENAPHAEPTPLQGAVALDGDERITRARRLEAALREYQMRQRELVAADERHHDTTRHVTECHVSVLTTSVNSARRAANGAAYDTRFARMTKSIDGSWGRGSTSRLRISLSRRRKRLRATAED